jgi:methylmalonyl-CoA/ethylmalonyl-CoA epimerase
MITGLSHVSLVVPDLESAAARIKSLYGLMVNDEQGVRLAYVDLGNARIELMQPSRDGSPVAKFLARNPHGGMHHFCLGVDSVEAASKTLEGAGARVLGGARVQHNVHGERIAFVHPGDFLGALVELEEHKT